MREGDKVIGIGRPECEAELHRILLGETKPRPEAANGGLRRAGRRSGRQGHKPGTPRSSPVLASARRRTSAIASVERCPPQVLLPPRCVATSGEQFGLAVEVDQRQPDDRDGGAEIPEAWRLVASSQNANGTLIIGASATIDWTTPAFMVCWAQTVPVTARIGPKSEFRPPQKSGRVVELASGGAQHGLL